MQETASIPPATTSHRRWIGVGCACLTFLAFVHCYLREFVLPDVPILFWGDQMLYATDGARMVAGQAPYRDYFQFLTPGTDLVYAFLFRRFGLALWIPNMVMVLLATIAVLLVTVMATKVLRSSFIGLPALLAVGFVLYGGLDATHHWFSTVIVMGAMLTLLGEEESWRIGLAGALCGVAASFTQNKGGIVLAGFVVWLVIVSAQKREGAGSILRRCLLLCAGALATFLVINGRYMVLLGIREWIRWVVIFPIRYYPTMPGQSLRFSWDDFRSHAGLVKWICGSFLYIVVPLTYLSFLIVFARRRKIENSQPWNQLLLIAITGLAMFLAVVPAPSIMRLSSVSMPATILLAWFFACGSASIRMTGWALALTSLVLALYLPLQTQRTRWHDLDLPAGRTAILDPERYDLYRWMMQQTHPGEMYFGIAPVSLPLRLACPAPIQSPGPWEYYRPEHIAASIDALERYRVPLLVLRSYASYAGTWGYKEGYLSAYEAYLDRHYRPVKSFADGEEVWARKDFAADTVVSSPPNIDSQLH